MYHAIPATRYIRIPEALERACIMISHGDIEVAFPNIVPFRVAHWIVLVVMGLTGLWSREVMRSAVYTYRKAPGSELLSHATPLEVVENFHPVRPAHPEPT